jgi:hypothetical protein
MLWGCLTFERAVATMATQLTVGQELAAAGAPSNVLGRAGAVSAVSYNST